MLILEKKLKYIPFYEETDLLYGLESGDKEIYTAWIEEQNQAAKGNGARQQQHPAAAGWPGEGICEAAEGQEAWRCSLSLAMRTRCLSWSIRSTA